jgi:predicted DNA binding CopG/RHH family protein
MSSMLLEEAAGNTLIKDKRINIRISSRDLTRIQKRAAKEASLIRL